MMLLDPTRLKTLRQFADEAPVFTVNYLRWLITHAEDNGFARCVVRCAGRIFIDPLAVTSWLAQQQAHPQPHQRGIAKKRQARKPETATV
jgi:hypothetical protein